MKTGMVQVDQEALAKATKGKLAIGTEAGKENGSPRAAAGRMKLPLRRSGSALRPALSATTNQIAAAVGSPKGPADVDMAQEAKMAAMVCSLENKDACLSCGS